MKKCPFCAEDIQDAAIVCKHCRHELPPAGKSGPRWERIVAAVAIVLGVGLWFLMPAADSARRADVARVAAANPPAAADRQPHAATDSYSSRYFQRMLITFGADLQSEFGGDLSALGLDGRQLQSMPVDEAYALAHRTALRLADPRTRRRFLLTLFSETEQ
jgi:hypothetical protein